MAELQRCYGPLRSTAVIANGRCARGYGVGVKEPFILAAGRVWDDAKNIALLSTLGDGIEWPICVAGDDRHPDGQRRELPGVRLLGTLSQSELARYYAKAALYCLPARYEPFGLSVVEAALSGCTLVLGDIPSLRENWEGCAAFVPPDDPAALEFRLRELTGNQERREALAARAIQRAQAFSIERMTTAYLTVYSQLMQNSVPLAVAGD
jgi:glycogen synthase